MEKRAFVDALEQLTKSENLVEVNREVDELRQQFEDYLQEEVRQFQIAELEAAEKGEDFDEVEWMPALREEFFGIYHDFKAKVKVIKDKIKEEQEENLRKKSALISQLRALIADEENIGAAFTIHKEISQKWKEVGDIPRTKRHDIQQEYSSLQEEFFYNINIYKDIKEYDFKKNFEAKQAIIEQLKILAESNELKELESNVKVLQNKWEDVGPTKQEAWEKIKDEYWTAINGVYEKIHSFYEKRREERKENIQKKKNLVEKLEVLLQKNRETVKDWTKQTEEVLKLQEEWKKIGFGARKENEEIWKEFRKLCDDFFEAKSTFFEGAQEQFDKIAEVKKELIQKVNNLKENTDWLETTKAIVSFQKQWKKAGNAGRRYEQKLWKEFRGACDYFFNAKEAYFEEQDQKYEGNLAEKRKLVEEIETFQLPENKKEATTKLKEFSQRFAEIGYVPKKEKDAIFQAYQTALNTHYKALNLEGIEKEKIMFEAHLDMIKGHGDAADVFAKEKRNIRNEMEKVKQQILQFENNLGFFVNAKGKNPLKEQAENNLKKEEEKLKQLIEKLKLIPNE